MDDIIGRKDFFKSLCNIRNDYELRRIFNGVNIMDIISIIENDVQISALYEMIDLDREMYSIKKKIKRYTKKGKKCKSLRERYNKLDKIYRKSIKNFRNLLGIRELKKESKPSKKYATIVRFNDMYSKNGKYEYFSSLFMDDDFDDDDEEYEYDPRDLLLNQKDEDEYLMERRMGRRGRAPLSRDLEIDDEDFDDDDDDYDSDVESRFEKIEIILEDQGDKMQKILSTMGALVAINNPGSERIPYLPASIVEEDTESETDDRLDRLERMMMSLIGGRAAHDSEETRYYDEDEENPLTPEQIQAADAAMESMFDQSPENGYTINPDDPNVPATVVEKDYESMEMPDLIRERNNLTEES